MQEELSHKCKLCTVCIKYEELSCLPNQCVNCTHEMKEHFLDMKIPHGAQTTTQGKYCKYAIHYELRITLGFSWLFSTFSIYIYFERGCAHFGMCISHSKLIDLDSKDTFCTIVPQTYFSFSPLLINKLCDTRDEAVVKIHNKIKIDIHEIGIVGTFSAVTSKLKYFIWSWNFGFMMRKNVTFHLTHKKVLLPVEAWVMKIWLA